MKIRNKAEIHHAIVSLIQSGVKRRIPEIKPVQQEFYLAESESVKRTEGGVRTASYHQSHRSAPIAEPQIPYAEKDRAWLEKAKTLMEKREKSRRESPAPEKAKEKDGAADEERIRYIGQAFHLFLIAEKGHDLYLVDQHAAHERILYDELISKCSVQPLLVPLRVEVDQLTDSFLSDHLSVYEKLGITIERRDEGVWEITAMPASCRSMETEIVDFIQSARVDGNELESRLFAIVACRAAIKAGDAIDRWSAEEILRKVFAMKEPACPHGRTFLMKISEKELRLLAGRTG